MNFKEISDKVEKYLATHREEIFARLAALCEIPSVRGQAAPGEPFGHEVGRAMRLAASFYEQEGFPVRQDKEGRFALAGFGTGKKKIGLFGHADVVPAGEGWTQTTAFVPCRRERSFFARGCEDNKGGIVAALYCMKAIRALSLPFRARAEAFIGTAEETGMEDIKAYTAAHPMPDASLVPDNAFPFCLGEKGRAEGWLVSPPLREIIDFCGGEALNQVLDNVRVTLRYRPALAEDLLARAAGKADITAEVCPEKEKLILTAHGVSAHASSPSASRNAAGIAATFLSECPELCPDERATLQVAGEILADPMGAALGIGGEDPHFGSRTAANGVARFRDGRLFLSEDIRYGTGVSFAELSAEIGRSLAGTGWEFRTENAADGFSHPEDGDMPRVLFEAFTAAGGSADARPYYSGGGTYAKHLRNAYSCGVTYRAPGNTPPVELPPGHGGVHEADEMIAEEEYLAGIRMLTVMTLAVAENLTQE